MMSHLQLQAPFCKRGVMLPWTLGEGASRHCWSSKAGVVLAAVTHWDLHRKILLLTGCDTLDKSVHVADSGSTLVKWKLHISTLTLLYGVMRQQRRKPQTVLHMHGSARALNHKNP